MLKRYLQGTVASSTLHAVILLAWSELAVTPQNAADFKYYFEVGVIDVACIDKLLTPYVACSSDRCTV